jgi:protein-tyrosine phosphatase
MSIRPDSLAHSARPKIVLFLCSGNYYRSRFAELLFDALAHIRGLPWAADSAGLKPDCFSRNPGLIANATLSALRQRGVAVDGPHRSPRDVCATDLCNAAHIVALKEAEHRPLLRERFPELEPRVEYWHVHDVDGAAPEQALPEIERHVLELIDRLFASQELESG